MESLKIVLINTVTILIMSAKIATLGIRKMKLFQSKGYDVVIFIYDVINKVLLLDLNCAVDVVM